MEDQIVALTAEDRDWLRIHGWAEPAPRPRDLGDKMILDCPRCGTELPIDSIELFIFGDLTERVSVERPRDVLRRHMHRCRSQAADDPAL